MKKPILLTILIIVIALVALGLFLQKKQETEKLRAITTFDACAAAGFPVQTSYPGQCRTSDGRVFVQELGDQMDHNDEIEVELPQINQKITSPFRIAGKARGPWFFEADFPVELVDDTGKSIAVSFVQAQGEWMTTDFVPFEGKLIFATPQTKNGKLILRSANPSGLPENQKEISIPVTF